MGCETRHPWKSCSQRHPRVPRRRVRWVNFLSFAAALKSNMRAAPNGNGKKPHHFVGHTKLATICDPHPTPYAAVKSLVLWPLPRPTSPTVNHPSRFCSKRRCTHDNLFSWSFPVANRREDANDCEHHCYMSLTQPHNSKWLPGKQHSLSTLCSAYDGNRSQDVCLCDSQR